MSIRQYEGSVYVCDWRQTGKHFEIQVRGNEKWLASASSFEEAEAKLLDLIGDASGDMQPCFEYDPDPPKEAVQARFDGGIVGVSGANDPLDFSGNAEELFTEGICKVCKFGKGERGNSPLLVGQFPNGSDGGFVRIRLGGPYGNMNVQIYSEQFIESLDPSEKRQFRWIPVEAAKKSKRKFLEPLSLSLIPLVMPKGLFSEAKRLQQDGFHCHACGRKQLAGIPQGSGGIFSFVSEAALPRPIPSCFQIGQSANVHFCMTKERWKLLRGTPGAKRLMSRQIGVVKKNWINPNPKLQDLKD